MVIGIIVILLAIVFFIIVFLLSLFIKGSKMDDEEYSLGQEDKIIIIEDVDDLENRGINNK